MEKTHNKLGHNMLTINLCESAGPVCAVNVQPRCCEDGTRKSKVQKPHILYSTYGIFCALARPS